MENFNNIQNIYADPAKKTLAEALKAFSDYCKPRRRKRNNFEKCQFWQPKFDEAAEIDNFIIELIQESKRL